MSERKVTQKEVIERLWAVLDESMHQAHWAPHVRREYTNGYVQLFRTNVRECGDCKATVRHTRSALKGLKFTEAAS